VTSYDITKLLFEGPVFSLLQVVKSLGCQPVGSPVADVDMYIVRIYLLKSNPFAGFHVGAKPHHLAADSMVRRHQSIKHTSCSTQLELHESTAAAPQHQQQAWRGRWYTDSNDSSHLIFKNKQNLTVNGAGRAHDHLWKSSQVRARGS
jgi:hypothetical protein